ncbi:MAG TPA: hypothetical protein VMF06_15565 [Candidatus Limnocylindria bacterium]|jgi:hypothetical protein|nr:hypothetical protein [Candidatus Limnocylindria bacterium]
MISIYFFGRRGVLVAVLGILMLLAGQVAAESLGSSFTYQGRLENGGVPATGSYDFEFSLYDVATNGAPIAASVTNSNISVVDGSFVVAVDFGFSPFDGNARWLQIAVMASGGSEFTPLSPRQALTPVPYSLFALNSVTPAELSYSSNALKTAIGQSSATLTGVLSAAGTAVSNYVGTVAGRVDGKLDATNGVATGMVLRRQNTNEPVHLTFSSPDGKPANAFQIGNGSYWGGLAVPYVRGVGAQCAFDVIPGAAGGGDTWIDICSNDPVERLAGVETLHLRKKLGGPAIIGANVVAGDAPSSTRGTYRNLLIQPFGRGNVGVGAFDAWDNNLADQPTSFFQVRPTHRVNLRMEHSQYKYLQTWATDDTGNQINWGFGNYAPTNYPLVPFEFQTAPNINIGLYSQDGGAGIAAFTDSGSANLPLRFQSTGLSASVDNGATTAFNLSQGESWMVAASLQLVAYGLNVSNDGRTSWAFSVTNSQVGVGTVAPQAGVVFEVVSQTNTAIPFPVMTTAQRSAITNAPIGAGIFNSDLGVPEHSSGGQWYRAGQRPSVVVSTNATTVFAASVDVLLLKGAGTRNVVLPTPASWTNRVVEIKDAAFNASHNTIVVSSPSGLVENRSTMLIEADGQSLRLVTDGVDWYKLN